jgi:response regulator RpfG family c-di-GMP phosphodiesterase
MLKAQLNEDGIEVIDFEDIDNTFDLRGCDFLENRKCALVVIDLLDGGYTLDRLRHIRKKNEGIPFLVLRGGTGVTDAQLQSAGFHLILRRPFSIGQIVHEVKDVLSHGSR